MKQIASNPAYYVNETGEVYSTFSKRILKKGVSTRGYVTVSLNDTTHLLHRIVAEAFIPNPLNLPEVDHKDEDKTNNNVSNLQWITTQANSEKEHAKHYIAEHIASGEWFDVYNLEKWCRDRKLTATALRSTGRAGSKDKSHKGFRLVAVAV